MITSFPGIELNHMAVMQGVPLSNWSLYSHPLRNGGLTQPQGLENIELTSLGSSCQCATIQPSLHPNNGKSGDGKMSGWCLPSQMLSLVLCRRLLKLLSPSSIRLRAVRKLRVALLAALNDIGLRFWCAPGNEPPDGSGVTWSEP